MKKTTVTVYEGKKSEPESPKLFVKGVQTTTPGLAGGSRVTDTVYGNSSPNSGWLS